MEIFVTYKNEECLLTEEQKEHILGRHPEATNDLISKCLQDPIEVRQSSSNKISHLYYIYKNKNRFFCVVIKICLDGNFISTAYTTNKIKEGKILFKKEGH